MATSQSPLNIEIDPTSYIQVMTYLKNVDNAGYKELQKAARKAAFEIKTAQQQAVRGLDSKGVRGGGRKYRALAVYAASNDYGSRKTANAARRVTSLRQAASRAVAVETRTTIGRGRSSSIRIRMRASKMAPGQQWLPKAMNKGRWRHPVFGTDTRVDQVVTPPGWFDDTFKRMTPKARAAILAATKAAYEKYRVR